MADDQPAFMPDSQSQYAFPSSAQGDQDDVAQSDQRNQQIQSAFDQQRFQRNMIQNLARSISRSQKS